jgi:two-component system, OmpR family, heavy metal sensor histidine kinase CusS
MKTTAASPQSIVRQLSWCLAVQMALGIGVLCVSIYWAADWLLDGKHRDALVEKTTIVHDLVRPPALKSREDDVIAKMQFLAPRRPGTRLALCRGDGSVLYRDPDEPPFVLSQHVRSMEIDIETQAAIGGPLRARLDIDVAYDVALLRQLAWMLVAATLASALFVGIATFWRVRRGLQPLDALARQTRLIQPERLDQRLALAQPASELQPWIEQFNALMARLERSYAQLEGFNADVAHELRTPLATLIGQTELALSRPRSTDALRETLVSNLEELQRLSAMVNDMLFLSHADRGAVARRGEPVSLAGLARQVVEFHEAPIQEAGLRVSVQGDARVAVDEPLIKRALSNLLGNAIRFAEPRSQIVVCIDPDAQRDVQISVHNRGPAIEPQHLSRLFDRFFRADASRQEGQQHHGLGLAIVAAIARMHAGGPQAESARGTTRVGFTVAG